VTGPPAGDFEGNVLQRLDARDAEQADPWTVLVMRSKLDPTVWVPCYGGDQTCFGFAGRFRAVKQHVEQAVARGHAGAWASQVEHAWYARDGDTWWYVPRADLVDVVRAHR
jgi:hypothetical protein